MAFWFSRNLRRSPDLQEALFCLRPVNPEGPNTQYLRSLVPSIMKGTQQPQILSTWTLWVQLLLVGTDPLTMKPFCPGFLAARLAVQVRTCQALGVLLNHPRVLNNPAQLHIRWDHLGPFRLQTPPCHRLPPRAPQG